ncbi:MAG: hypothetical protein O7E56_05480 [SAR324 cluster bacterium]|nr:hypothetical protein [SAR324 cluster bacterium]
MDAKKAMAAHSPGLCPRLVMRAVLLVLGGLLAALSCQAEQPSRLQRIASYPGALSLPLQDKISFGDTALLDWQHKINLKYGMDVRPSRAAADNPLVAYVRSMIAALPVEIQRLASKYMVALYLLEHDWGTGTTEAIQDAQGRWRYAYVALNLTVLTRKANAWGSWKEESAFRPESSHAIRMVLESAPDDTHEAAIRFIFLHELGHVLGLALAAHGYWDAEQLPAATEHSPYLRISWQKSAEGKMVSRWPQSTFWFSKLAFYNSEASGLSLAQAEAAYRALARTDFPSLYGTTNPFDDFAEAFAIYVHTRMLGKPYRVDILRDGKPRFTFRSCITTGACKAKVKALQKLLGFG